MISASFVTNKHALLITLALKMAGQIELDRNSIRSAESIRIDYSQLYFKGKSNSSNT